MLENKTAAPLPTQVVQGKTTRLLRTGFGAVIVLIIFLSGVGVYRIDGAYRTLDNIVGNEQVAVETLYRMQLAARDRTSALFTIVHTDDALERDAAMLRFNEQGRRFGEARAKLLSLRLNETEMALMEQQRQQTAVGMPLQEQVIELTMAGRRDEAEALLIREAMPAQERMIETLTAFLEHETEETRMLAQKMRDSHTETDVLMATGGVLGVLLATLIAVSVIRKTNGLVADLSSTSQQLHESMQDLQFQKFAMDEHNIVSIADVYGKIIYANEKFSQVSQYTLAELLGKNHRILKSGAHPDALYAHMWETIASGKVWQGEVCNRRKDGALYWVATTIVPCLGDDGLPYQYISVRTDITQIKEAQRVLERNQDTLERAVQDRTRELSEREEVLRSITNAAQDAVIMIDHAGLVTYWNPAAEQLFGFSAAEIMGHNLHDLIMPERYLARHQEGFAQFGGTGQGALLGRTTEVGAKRKDGTEFPVEIALSAVKLHGQWSAVGIVRDISVRKQTEERLTQLATTDTLTGICNRRRFDEVLSAEIDRATRFATPLSLIIFDIDHFKRVNDSFGHQAGDRVLIQLALTISSAIRTTDLFARWGGEEFTILAPNCDINSSRLLAEKLRMTIEKQHFADVGQVTCSFGVADFAPGDNADSLMKKVDRCLYRAKEMGRNRVETCITGPVT
ncbi:MAG: diguanylate cyclase [Pseudomonadota bacterium]